MAFNYFPTYRISISTIFYIYCVYLQFPRSRRTSRQRLSARTRYCCHGSSLSGGMARCGDTLYCTVLYCTVLQVLSYTLYKRYQRSVSTLTVPGTERQFTFKGIIKHDIARPAEAGLGWSPSPPLILDTLQFLLVVPTSRPPADQPISAPLFNSRSLCDC